MPGGRPPKWTDPAKLQVLIDAYFDKCDKTGKPYTITGLAVALDTSRETLLDYGNKEEFSDTIKRAKVKIHKYAEEYLCSGKSATGAIFNLKNNWGWKDKQEVEHSGEMTTIEKINYITPDGDNTKADSEAA